jgi:glycosyltransferase involved in cell wall biosynthesis
VPSSDVEALAGRLGDLIQDRALRQRLGKQAAELAQEFSWEIIAHQIRDQYQELIYKDHPASD